MSSPWFQVHLIRSNQPLLRSRWARPTATVLALLFVIPVAAMAQGSPFDTGLNAIQALFTGTIAKVASLVAIVIGGYGFAHGGPSAKKALAGVAAGTGIAVLAVNVLSWLWGVCAIPAIFYPFRPRSASPLSEWPMPDKTHEKRRTIESSRACISLSRTWAWNVRCFTSSASARWGHSTSSIPSWTGLSFRWQCRHEDESARCVGGRVEAGRH
jgi:type IV secretion system protein VirB2